MVRWSRGSAPHGTRGSGYTPHALFAPSWVHPHLSFSWTKTVTTPHDIMYRRFSNTRNHGVLRAVVNVTRRAPGRMPSALAAIAAKVSSVKHVELAKTTSPSVQSNSGARKEPCHSSTIVAAKELRYEWTQRWIIMATR